ncbi:MAG: hypothetical protein Q4F69_03355 [Bacteroidia bacterium]|nr:hypothetical protein [Bacteroidia bacterium]
MKKLLLLCVGLVFLVGCGQIEENKQAEEQQRIEKIKSEEALKVQNYIKVNGEIGVKETHLFSDDEYEMNAEISSIASYVNYSNVVIQISYESKNGILLKNEIVTFNGIVKSAKTPFRCKVNPPKKKFNFSLKVLSASVSNK